METTDNFPIAGLNSCSQTMAEPQLTERNTAVAAASSVVEDEDLMDESIIDRSESVHRLADGNHSTTTDDHSSMANLDYSGPSTLGLILAAKPKGKRRRRKTKQKLGTTKPYKISSWRYQLAPPAFMRNNSSDATGGESTVQRQRSKFVPYNTNKFLMEEHMPHATRGRGADPTADSMDSDGGNNYFTSIPLDEEEFLTKEFSSVYESARSERLESMSKNQLMREYLQLEANYDKLSRNLDARKMERDNQIRALEDRVRGQGQEILELRRQLADSRNRRVVHSHHERRSNVAAAAPIERPPPFNGRLRAAHSSSSSSADSDSDSTGSDSSSSGSDSHSSLSASESPAVVFSSPSHSIPTGQNGGECN